MPTVPLMGGAFAGRSPIASFRQCINLYPESYSPDQQPPMPVTHYPTPGLDLLSVSPTVEGIRSSYRASNGALYTLVGPNVYYVDDTFAWTLLGSIPDNTTPANFADNGSVIVIVDGTAVGYAIDMDTNAFGTITDPSFYGAISAIYLDTYFIFNRPGTAEFYISLSNVTYAMLTGSTGRVLSGSIATGGTLYVDGSYPAVPLTGGTGAGATAAITVAGGIVTVVTIVNPGSGYTEGDVLSANNANLGGAGSGFGYSVESVATAFDPLDIAAKTGSADNIACLATVHGELWLIGELATEIWANTGAADFPFQRIQGAFVDHGAVAPYSLSQQDISLFWLEQDRQGNGIIVQSDGYSVKQISTRYIEQQIQGYSDITDAVGFCHQISGHAFYVLFFPTADVTWVFDLATSNWHLWSSIDSNGVLHRNRSNCYAFAYGMNIVGDYQNGNLYALSSEVYTDNGIAIPRIISFPHLIKDGQRVTYKQFQAKMEVGQTGGTTESAPPRASLRWSDTGGLSWGQPVMQSIGAAGQYLTSPQWQRLGLARDRVFELSWSAPSKVVLNGAFLTFQPART
jgi:hypothetical protein